MKLLAPHLRSLILLASFLSSFIGCASSLSGRNIMEVTDETEVHGCKNLGLVTGNSHWGGLTGQELSLEVAKKRALAHARAKGATHVLWLNMTKGFFGASVSGKAYVCSENAITGKSDSASRIIPLSKSLTSKKQAPGGYAAVMRFESVGMDSGVSMVITDIFTNQIQANGKYRVMERSQMNRILSEQGFQNSGACSSTECAVEIGRLLSIDKMFVGSIGRLGESWVINIRIISIQTGEILSNVSKQVVGKVDNLSPAAIQMANELSQ
jgi:Curli production assembly/transport component CsgG